MGQYWASMQQARAMEQQAKAQERAGLFGLFGNLGSAAISAGGNVWSAQIKADAMESMYDY